MSLRPVIRPVPRDDVRYLRREGNRKVRAARRRRTAARWTVISLGVAAAASMAIWGAGQTVSWTLGTGRFPMKTVVVRGHRQAAPAEIEALLEPWKGRNLLTLDLSALERAVRTHPWVGSSGWVRMDRRFPSTLLVTIEERAAGGMALLGGVVWLLDDRGLPIDRFGPRYAGEFDFPLVKGLDARRASGDGEALARALGKGVAVSRALEQGVPAFWQEVSEIDVAEEHEVALRLEGLDHDVRLSAADPLQNLDSYLALRDRLGGPEDGAIEYVDLRWRDRITVMPAARNTTQNGGK